MYGQYSRAVSNQERVMIARVRQIKKLAWVCFFINISFHSYSKSRKIHPHHKLSAVPLSSHHSACCLVVRKLRKYATAALASQRTSVASQRTTVGCYRLLLGLSSTLFLEADAIHIDAHCASFFYFVPKPYNIELFACLI